MLKKLAFYSVCLAGLAFASQANALILNWNLGGAATSSGDTINTLTFVSGGHALQVKGYCSSQSDGSGAFSGAHVAVLGGGLGVSSGGDSTVCSGDPTTYGGNNFLLLEFDTFMFAKDFQIGFKKTDADVQVWFGPASGVVVGLDLSGSCVSGCATTLAALGFTTLPINNSQTINATTNKSRYVVISGALSAVGGSIDGNSDYRKISNSTQTKIPLPSTGMLFALGLLGMTLSCRSRIVVPNK